MKRSIIFLSTLISATLLYGQADPSPYLPEIFGGFPNVRDYAPGPNRDEIYFTAESYKKEFSAICFSKKVDGNWTAPQIAPFSGQYSDLEPFFSPDGLTLFFVSRRPVSAGGPKTDADIWFVKRNTISAAWSSPQRLEGPVNTEKDEYYPSVAANGNLYFTRESDDPKRKEDIFRSVYVNGQYALPVALSDSINSGTYEFNAFVTPDEQYILFTSYGRPDDMGGSDLYLSRKNAAGEWTAAQHLGPQINSRKIDYCPFWDQQKKVLYFTSERSAIPGQQATPLSAPQLQELFQQYSNGQSRIYRVDFDGTVK